MGKISWIYNPHPSNIFRLFISCNLIQLIISLLFKLELLHPVHLPFIIMYMYFHYFAMHDIKLHGFFSFFFYSIVEIAMGFIFFLNNFFYSIVKTSMDHIPWRFSMLTYNSYCFYDFVQYVCNAIKIQETPSLLHCQTTSRLPGRS